MRHQREIKVMVQWLMMHDSDGSSMKKQTLDIKIEKGAVDHESDGATLNKQIQDTEIHIQADK
jgi:hypothetical protein